VKEPGEFRIAVFGDSYTECETNNFTWVDVLHRGLSANQALLKQIGKRKITVANFGIAGAGFHYMAGEYLYSEDAFQPDLTIFAFIDEDFERLGKARLDLIAANRKRDIRHWSAAWSPKSISGSGVWGRVSAIPLGKNVFDRSLYFSGSDESLIFDKKHFARTPRRF